MRATDDCEGSLVLHAGSWVECTEPACDDRHRARHAWTHRCDELWTGCPCEAPSAPGLLG